MQCNKKQLKNQSLVFMVIFWNVRSLTWKSNADVGRELENGWIVFSGIGRFMASHKCTSQLPVLLRWKHRAVITEQK